MHARCGIVAVSWLDGGGCLPRIVAIAIQARDGGGEVGRPAIAVGIDPAQLAPITVAVYLVCYGLGRGRRAVCLAVIAISSWAGRRCLPGVQAVEIDRGHGRAI